MGFSLCVGGVCACAKQWLEASPGAPSPSVPHLIIWDGDSHCWPASSRTCNRLCFLRVTTFAALSVMLGTRTQVTVLSQRALCLLSRLPGTKSYFLTGKKKHKEHFNRVKEHVTPLSSPRTLFPNSPSIKFLCKLSTYLFLPPFKNANMFWPQDKKTQAGTDKKASEHWKVLAIQAAWEEKSSVVLPTCERFVWQ